MKFCYCGLPSIKELNGVPLCHKHNKPQVKTPKRGRFSGRSKSINRFNDYN